MTLQAALTMAQAELAKARKARQEALEQYRAAIEREVDWAVQVDLIERDLVGEGELRRWES